METLIKNQKYTVRIDGYSSDASGVCHIGGCAVFVPRAIPGELWEVKLLKIGKNCAYAKGETLLESSPVRVDPLCPHYGKCGGCDAMHMSYDEELRFKLGRANDAFTRIGKQSFTAADIHGSDKINEYRNKGIFVIGESEGKAVPGFYRERSHQIVPVTQCLIQDAIAFRAAQTVSDFMNINGLSAYDEKTGSGTVRHVFCRRALKTDDRLLCIVSRKGFGAKTEALVSFLREKCPELTGIVLNINRSVGNTVLAGDFYTLWGKGSITDILCGFSFDIAPQAFFQINPPQAEKLYSLAVEFAEPTPDKLVFDLYCGAGTISLALSKNAGRVIGAEIVPEAIENAKKNAERNSVTNAEFICADAAQAAKELASRGLHPDVVSVDPPRKGMSEEAVAAVAEMKPERIVYVSCDPATLARDILRFNGYGYELIKASAVDMFPRTRHVETVVLLSMGEISSRNIRVEFPLEDMDITSLRGKATYDQIKGYIEERFGMKVSTLYISQIKRKCGLEVGESYNKSKNEDSKVPVCPPEKEMAIMDALKHFGII